MANPHPLAVLLREARRRKRLTQAAVAELAGYAESSLAHWEQGAKSPGIDSITDWAAALGFDLTLTRRDTEGSTS